MTRWRSAYLRRVERWGFWNTPGASCFYGLPSSSFANTCTRFQMSAL